MNNLRHFRKKHPRFIVALFGAFFKMFGWIKVEKVLGGLLKKTMHDDKVPTDAWLDESIERLGFYMESVWPLISLIVREKTINFFRYKLRRFCIKLVFLCIILCMGIGLYKIYNLYIQKPKVVYVETVKKNSKGLIINTDTIFIPAERSFLTKDNLDYFASEMDIKHWYDVRKQIITETGFTSDLCVKGGNLFGMMFPGQRETTSTDTMFGFAKYKHWVYSLYDYKLWQDLVLKRVPMRKWERYSNWLKRVGYAEAPDYAPVLENTNWYSFKPKYNY